MGARVALDGAEENPPVHRVTQLDTNGCFAFSRIPPGRYRVGPDPYGEHTATLLERRDLTESLAISHCGGKPARTCPSTVTWVTFSKPTPAEFAWTI